MPSAIERGVALGHRAKQRVILKVLAFSVASISCTLVARAVSGHQGLQGAIVGVGAGAVLCLASHGLLGWARRAQGRAVLTAMLASVILSFVFVLAAILLISAYWPEILNTSVITLLVVYLSFRFMDIFATSSRLSRHRVQFAARHARREVASPRAADGDRRRLGQKGDRS